jgi:hypothetical protein
MHEDLARAGSMSAIAIALSQYAESLAPSGRFISKGRRWVYDPNNFVTFEVQPRKKGVVVTLQGTMGHFRERAEAFGHKDEYVENLEPDRSGYYCRYPVRNAKQILAAAQFIKWAFENSKKSK